MLSIRLFYTNSARCKSARLGFSGFLLAGSTSYQLYHKHISFNTWQSLLGCWSRVEDGDVGLGMCCGRVEAGTMCRLSQSKRMH